MKYFSLFSGVGGFEIGIEKAYVDVSASARKQPGGVEVAGGDTAHHQEPMGMEQPDARPVCVGFSEIDKHASAVLRYRFPNVTNYGDITKIDWSGVPDFDLLVGGSPCQDLSIAGKRAGLEGGRSGLFYEYVRALEEKKPEHFIWENVKGALSSNGGRDFAAVLSALAEAGYSLWWQVLNAKDFGVPQNRERIFIVGSRSGSPREVFFETRLRQENSRVAAEGSGRRNRTWGGCLRKEGTSSFGSGDVFIGDESQIRRLTPVECERLMSWPDHWTRCGDYGEGPKEISDTQRYKMCGNGVVSAVVCEVVKAHLLTRKEE